LRRSQGAAVGWAVGEKAAPVLSPGRRTGEIVLRRDPDRLATGEFGGEGIARWFRSSGVRLRLGFMTIKVRRCRDDRGGDKGEAGRPAERGDVKQTPRHQWNICAAPGW
jgi:hypothetical protein